MKAQETEHQSTERQPYEKPTLMSISLVADQVMGFGCKTSAMVNQSVGQTSPCVVQLCRAVTGT